MNLHSKISAMNQQWTDIDICLYRSFLLSFTIVWSSAK